MRRTISILTLICFILTGPAVYPAHAQDFNVNQLPIPGTMVAQSAPFIPVALKGLIINPHKPLEFQFIVDPGQAHSNTADIREQTNQLVKYFLAGLTIPEGDLWVNLSPYEKDLIVPDALGQTDLGRDLLAQDYILKQLTATLIYPEKDLGKEFWSKVYQKSKEQFGTTNVPVNTFNKVWIVPNQARVFTTSNAAYVTQSSLTVMLDEDYLAKKKHRTTQFSTMSSKIIRSIVIPEIEKEVNTGKNFALLRQIYQALILAKWYKETIENGLLDAVYINKNKTAGVNLSDPDVKAKIYSRYLQAYKKGVFNYIKDDEATQMPRKYFSGGVLPMPATLAHSDSPMIFRDHAMLKVDVTIEKVVDAVKMNRRRFLNLISKRSVVLGLFIASSSISTNEDYSQEAILYGLHYPNATIKNQLRDAINANSVFEYLKNNPGSINYLKNDPQLDAYAADLEKIADRLISDHNIFVWAPQDMQSLSGKDNEIVMYDPKYSRKIMDQINASLKAKGMGDLVDRVSLAALRPEEYLYLKYEESLKKRNLQLLSLSRKEINDLLKVAKRLEISAKNLTWAQFNNTFHDEDRNFLLTLFNRIPSIENLNKALRILAVARNEVYMDPNVVLQQKVTMMEIIDQYAMFINEYKKVLDRRAMRIAIAIKEYGAGIMVTFDASYIGPISRYLSQIAPPDTRISTFNEEKPKTATDKAMKGGIDLNQIKINPTGQTLKMQFDPAELSQILRENFKGFQPVITDLQYTSNPAGLLESNLN